MLEPVIPNLKTLNNIYRSYKMTIIEEIRKELFELKWNYENVV